MIDDITFKKARGIACNCLPMFEAAVKDDPQAAITAAHLLLTGLLASIGEDQARKVLTAQLALGLLGSVEGYRDHMTKCGGSLSTMQAAGHA